jgi:intracellular septation protein A
MTRPAAAGSAPAKGTSYAISYLIDIVAPIAIYLVLHSLLGVDEFLALLIATVVTAANTAIGTVRRGRLDTVGVLVIIELVLSLGFVLITHSAQVLLFKPAVLIGVGALYGLFTCVRGKPLGYHTTMPMVAGGNVDRAVLYERFWNEDPKFRAKLRAMTAAWGIAFLIDSAVRFYYAINADITTAVVTPQLIEFGLIALAIVASATQVPYVKRLVEEADKANRSTR